MNVMTRERQLEIVEEMIANLRAQRQSETVQALKGIAADLRARLDLPRSNALGELEREMQKLADSKTIGGYPPGRMIAVAHVIIRKWPTVRQALEQFGEESAS